MQRVSNAMWWSYVRGAISMVLFMMWSQDRHGGLDGYVAYLQNNWTEFPVWAAWCFLLIAVGLAAYQHVAQIGRDQLIDSDL
jgi:hypothetical protein